MPDVIKSAMERYVRLVSRWNPSYRAMAEEGLCHTIVMYGASEYHRGYQDGMRACRPNEDGDIA